VKRITQARVSTKAEAMGEERRKTSIMAALHSAGCVYLARLNATGDAVCYLYAPAHR